MSKKKKDEKKNSRSPKKNTQKSKELTESTFTWCGRLVATSDAWSPESPLAAAIVVTVWRRDQRERERSKVAGVLGVAASEGGDDGGEEEDAPRSFLLPPQPPPQPPSSSSSHPSAFSSENPALCACAAAAASLASFARAMMCSARLRCAGLGLPRASK